MSTLLDRGDIAFAAFRSDDPDAFAFVALRDIAEGTQILFTDNAWTAAGALGTTEGTVRWTAPAGGLAAGAVVNVTGADWTAVQGSFALSTAGDQILAYQGAVGAPDRVLAGISSNAYVTTGATTSNTSYLPGAGTADPGDDLILGATAIQLTGTATDVDDGQYGAPGAPTSGTTTELRTALNTRDNWTLSNEPIPNTLPAAYTASAAGINVSPLALSLEEGGPAGTVRLALGSQPTADVTISLSVGPQLTVDVTTVTFTPADWDVAKTVTVTAVDDAVAEGTRSATLVLGPATSADAAFDGVDPGDVAVTIADDDVALTAIGAIQGAGHKSPFVGGAVGVAGNSGTARVSAEGVVTALAANGFYVQGAPDGDDRTSDGIFVFTGGAPPAGLAVGETVRVLDARVDEFRPGATGLTVTQLTATVAGASVQDLGGGTEVAPAVIGPGGRPIPTGAIASPGFAAYDPATYAADFWEGLEGMRVEVPNPVAVGPTAEFRTRSPADPANAAGPPNEEIWVTTPGGFDPASQNSRGELTIAPGDFNPERIQLDDLLPAVDLPSVSVGARLETVRGVVNYDFGNYEVLVPTAPVVAAPSPLTAEVTGISRDVRQVTVGDYNVENLDPVAENTSAWGTGGVAANGVGGVTGLSSGNGSGDLYTRLGNADDDVGSGKYAAHAAHIAVNMGAPSVVALQEIQDDDGATISNVLSSDLTLRTLTDLIQANHGVQYAFAYVAPAAANINGGQPNANIRNAFLYRPDEAALKEYFLLDPTNPAFDSSRKPLVAVFDLNGVELTVVNNHLNSKGGDTPLFGNAQPPVLTSEAQRIEQAKVINAYVDSLLAADPAAKVMVVGDLNDFAWSNPILTLEGRLNPTGPQVLFDLGEALLPPNERYTYVFEGNSQALDHQLVSGDLLANGDPAYDVVHLNSEFYGAPSDHDPSVARLDFRAYAEFLRMTEGPDALDGLGGDDTVLGLGGDDSLSGGEGADALRGGGGRDLLAGDAGADRLLGGGGDDTLRGGAGNDALDGGGGDDVLTGDAGADRFLVGGGAGADLITDFEAGLDRVRVEGFADFAAMRAALADTTRGALLTLAGGTVMFEGLAAAELSRGDFVLA